MSHYPKDFKNQHDFNRSFDLSSSVKLIASDQRLVDRLQENIPEYIKAFSTAEHFHYNQSINLLFQQEPRFKDAIKFLCARPDEADKIDAVAVVLLGTWASSGAATGQAMMVSALINKAKENHPSYIRLIKYEPSLQEDVRQILDEIPNFEYNMERGFLSWRYLNGLEEGILSYDCLDSRFLKFQELVKRQRPKEFEDLEGLLLS